MSDRALIKLLEQKVGGPFHYKMEGERCTVLDLTSTEALFNGLIRHHAREDQQEILKIVCGLAGLRELNLRRNKIGRLPSEFRNLQELQVLNLGSNALLEVPPVVLELCQLRSLHLGNNGLAELPPGMRALTQLEHLWLHKNIRLRSLEPLAELRALKTLNLFFLNLHELPGFIYQLEQLVSLTLWNVSGFTDELARLGKLQFLSICGTPGLKALPRAFTTLKQLRMVRLFQNRLASLPEEFGELRALEQVSLYQNRLATLPDSFGALRHLKKLNLGWNCFQRVPECLRQCASLEWLALFANPLEADSPMPSWPGGTILRDWPFTTLPEPRIT
jgi:Leucine-rich repeat (LRR) protein